MNDDKQKPVGRAVRSTSVVGQPCPSCRGRGEWTDDRRGSGDKFDGQLVDSVRWKCCRCKGTGRLTNVIKSAAS